MIGDHGLLVEQGGLADVAVHPPATVLVVAREIVGEEQSERGPIRIEDLEDAHIGVVNGQIGSFLEGETVKLVRSVEHAVLEDAIQLEVGSDLALIERVAGLAERLCIEGPVPGFEWEGRVMLSGRLSIDQVLQIGGILFGPGERGGRESGEHVMHGGGIAGRLVCETIGGVVGITQEGRALGAEVDELGDDRGVVR